MAIRIREISAMPPDEVQQDDIEKQTKKLVKKIGELQRTLYAEARHSLLIVLQGMDASGKDGTARRVLAKTSAAGVDVYSFKKPTTEEFAHDFLWRVHRQVPRKGYIQVFNRSHYEDVLIQRVHRWITEEHAIKRMEAINAFEDLLQFDNGTVVLKFYLHLDQERQREKLQERIDHPHKQWKHNPSDWDEHARWDQYMTCYEDVINRSQIPWVIVPANVEWYRNYVVASKVYETLKELDPKLPGLSGS
ncbi:MAG TPA: polyphosphate kinase [Saprospiraceae bacterium]|nr:polyphosphate kinase [Saprospiraceae bacterium]